MIINKKLDKIFKISKKISIDDNSKIVIMSDCHRGASNNYNDFSRNKNIYEIALLHYYNSNFTYIELGDGDEMWEVKNYEDIISENLDIFKQLSKLHILGRFIMIYGNHDIPKKYQDVLEKYFYNYYDKKEKMEKPLLNDLVVHESLVLNYKDYDIFLIHGHQVDFLNSTLWKFTRFLVQNIWSLFERIGIKELTSAVKNHKVAKRIEKRLKKWSIKNNKILIAGHTHRPIFPKYEQSLYFNDGSCVHLDGITCIEIQNGNISLVKWGFKFNKDKLISIERTVLDGNEPIVNFINK